jgi:hypothetical protein
LSVAAASAYPVRIQVYLTRLRASYGSIANRPELHLPHITVRLQLSSGPSSLIVNAYPINYTRRLLCSFKLTWPRATLIHYSSFIGAHQTLSLLIYARSFVTTLDLDAHLLCNIAQASSSTHQHSYLRTPGLLVPVAKMATQLSHGKSLAIVVATRTSSVFSVLGSTFIITTFLFFPCE